MYLKSLELVGFKSFGKKSTLEFSTPITAVVGPNGSGKSNTAEAFRFVLGEQSMKSLRGKRGEDLIWGGSSEVPRSNRASVKAVFDNTRRLLEVDFDEVVIERSVFRDGTNEYLINGSKVRLKDVVTLLSGANIGSSGHHIISQGEADRILASSARERRQIIEDALGLRIYEYKKEESIKKLQKTEENKTQVEALRKENLPHLRFLERQMEKLERARSLREELVHAYHEYLKYEEIYLTYEKEKIEGEREDPKRKLKEIEYRVEEIRDVLEKTKKGSKESEELLALEKRLSDLRNEESEATRILGRLEGQIVYEERRIEEEKKKVEAGEGRPIPYKEAQTFLDTLSSLFGSVEDTSPEDTIRTILKKARETLASFSERFTTKKVEYIPDLKMLEALKSEEERTKEELSKVQERILGEKEKVRLVTEEIEKGKDKNRDIELELYTLIAKQTELRSTLTALDVRENTLRRDEEEFKREVGEGIALIGRNVQGYKDFVIETHDALLEGDEKGERGEQLERRRKLEKMKIRLEEMGGASADEITKEYTEVKERDAFLERELKDLTESSELLHKLIVDLETELEDRFKKGLSSISAQFNSFFILMFGGGSASLTTTVVKKGKDDDSEDDEEEKEGVEKAGVDIEVSLPKKRIQSLMMLSGGERALTSIALIFAMSQVNPPPFLILDETDAALDEANSRRYGDMISTLSQKSQLIVITHNRETMSRADVLYGITMGSDGVSRILSVKLDDAVAVAK